MKRVHPEFQMMKLPFVMLGRILKVLIVWRLFISTVILMENHRLNFGRRKLSMWRMRLCILLNGQRLSRIITMENQRVLLFSGKSTTAIRFGGSMNYRALEMNEVDKIEMIDATCFIKNAWRMVEGQLRLVQINWTDHELPNGLKWHKKRFKETLELRGRAFGCFDENQLIGYATLNADIFGNSYKYVLLDQMFISNGSRNKGIGKALFDMCASQARQWGAQKLYLCAGSSEDTIAFYHKLGCVDALEVNQQLYEQDPNDKQLEFDLER